MMRAAIYARYSTDLQRDRSIDDQLAVCREFAARNGWAVVEEYTDRAQSGASIIGRAGLSALVEAGKRRAFDIVVAEHGDRISRVTEELDGIRRRLHFAGITIHTVNAGIIDETQAAIQGLMGALFLRELANKVRRGLSGVVRDGRYAGGRPYGYRSVPGEAGRLAVVEAEAEVIRRIFAEFADGATPRMIAGGLNQAGIAPPRGKAWNASTITGNLARGHGLIANDLYAGRVVWNRIRMIKDPDTGKRVSRINPKAEWQSSDAPELRIVDADLWARVEAVRAQRSKTPAAKRRAPTHMLSGLLRCGCCGSGYSVHDRDKTGKTRIRCSSVRENGICANRRIIYLVSVERAVVSSLAEHLENPWLLREYVEAYNAERQRLSRSGPQEAARLQAVRDAALSELERVKRAFIRGMLDEHEAQSEMARIRRDLEALDDKLAMIGAASEVLTLEPAAIAAYRRSVSDLGAALNAHIGAESPSRTAGMKAVADLRLLIETVTIFPEGPRGPVEVEIRGRLDELLGDAGGRRPLSSGGEVVAREGFEPPTQGL